MTYRNIPLNERIIFALDVDSVDDVNIWLDQIGHYVKFFKIGLQLFLACGWNVVDMITSRGYKVMLDLKFFDIPKTVELAFKQLNNRGISYATVHGTDSIIKAALAAGTDTKILAVTVLTSTSQNNLKDMGFERNVGELVFKRAKEALDIGCHGVVCSGLEVSEIRKQLGSQLITVTPGIRIGEKLVNSKDDQSRIITARQAIINGSDYIVIGRPISKASNPISVIRSIQQDIQEGLLERHIYN